MNSTSVTVQVFLLGAAWSWNIASSSLVFLFLISMLSFQPLLSICAGPWASQLQVIAFLVSNTANYICHCRMYILLLLLYVTSIAIPSTFVPYFFGYVHKFYTLIRTESAAILQQKCNSGILCHIHMLCQKSAPSLLFNLQHIHYSCGFNTEKPWFSMQISGANPEFKAVKIHSIFASADAKHLNGALYNVLNAINLHNCCLF